MGGTQRRGYSQPMPVHVVLLLVGVAVGGWAARGRHFWRWE